MSSQPVINAIVQTLPVKVKRLDPAAIVPQYATPGAGAFDLHAVTINGSQNASFVGPNHPLVIGTGLAFEIPAGHAMFVFSRSGHGFSFGVTLANAVGVIDSDYRGEVKVKLTTAIECDDAAPLLVKPGDRIAQALILPVPTVRFDVVDELGDTQRGAGGFGSTGA